MDIKLAILAVIALAAVLQLQFHPPYISIEWLSSRSSAQTLCASVDLERGCVPFVERSRWTRPQVSQVLLVSSR